MNPWTIIGWLILLGGGSFALLCMFGYWVDNHEPTYRPSPTPQELAERAERQREQEEEARRYREESRRSWVRFWKFMGSTVVLIFLISLVLTVLAGIH